MENNKIALVLSGGGARGAYEIGVCQALRYLDMKPDMVYGTSVGSINGAMVVQDKLDLAVSLWKELETDKIFDISLTDDQKRGKKFLPETAKAYAKEILFNGGAGNNGLRSILEKYVDEDAIRNSKVEYGLTTVEIPTFTPYHLYIKDIPKGLLYDYILASSAVFPAIKPQEIDGKKYIDGGFADVLPISMAIARGARRIICVYLDALGIKQEPKFQEGQPAPEIITIESKWDLGNVLNFDRKNAAKLINLGFLDGLKAFDVLQGDFYSFPRGEFDKKTMREADAAAKVFELNPEVIYRKGSLNAALDDALQKIKEHTSVSSQLASALKEHSLKSDRELPSLKDLPKGLSLSKALLKEMAQDHLALISEGLASPAVSVAIAENIREYPEISEFFIRRGSRGANTDHVRAAQYLLKAGLV